MIRLFLVSCLGVLLVGCSHETAPMQVDVVEMPTPGTDFSDPEAA